MQVPDGDTSGKGSDCLYAGCTEGVQGVYWFDRMFCSDCQVKRQWLDCFGLVPKVRQGIIGNVVKFRNVPNAVRWMRLLNATGFRAGKV